MAFMKSTSGSSKDRWYLTGEFTVDRLGKDVTAARGVAAALGFASTKVTHEQLVAEIDRVEARRAAFIAELCGASQQPVTDTTSKTSVV
jgi:hypothetical protein